jgi:extracellular factor (EF) 3-hydroxypalmitic acid methyl ester biosynthesis protein
MDAASSNVASLSFLTTDAHRLLLERAREARFARDEVILAEGSRQQALYLVQRGFVRVERAHLGHGIAVARRGPGELFGEMSFLDGVGAIASVAADEDDVVVVVINGAQVNALLASVPGLAARFYQSLAVMLSVRLRELTTALPPLIVEDVPQVSRVAAQRTGRKGHEQIPATLLETIEEFKTTLLRIDRGLKDRKIEADEAQSGVSTACDGLKGTLREHVLRDGHLEPAIGTYVFREAFPFLMLSRFIDRAFTKPRGYAGDYATIEMLYEDSACGDGRLGPLIDRWTRQVPAAQAVKNRRALMANAIRTAAAEWRGSPPMPVTSLAAGPARELFDVLAPSDAPDVLATCVDIDNEALAYASDKAHTLGLSHRFTFAQDNIVRLCRGRGHTELGPQALIYSIGLTDYLHDGFVVDLMNWAYDRLLSGGTLIIGNVVPSNPDKAYMDHILEWPLIHRSAEELRDLFRQSRFGTGPVRLELEPAGVDLFGFCRKV